MFITFHSSCCYCSFFLQHNFKKLRNSLLASGFVKEGCDSAKKVITRNGSDILWKHWAATFHWDDKGHNLKLNHRLSEEHIKVDKAGKMRNYLAFEVLDKNFLHLMKEYACVSQRQDMEASMELLTHSSVLIDNFTDLRVVTSKDAIFAPK